MVVAVDAVEDPVGEVDLVVPGGGVAPLPPLLHDHVPAPLPRPPASRHCQPLLRQPGTGEKNHTEGKCKGRRC